mgnify:CR=1 FL=1
MSKDYGAKNIQVLKGLEPVRKRPGMYIGSTGKAGLHHLVTEVVDNSIDEAIAGVCKNIEITLFEDGSVEVKDDGRGIPVGIHEEEKKSTLELVMTVLHAGGKFNKESYKFSSGLHGVGVSVVNALSEWLQVWVMQGGKLYTQRYARGVPLDKVQEVGEAEGHGTIVRFKPDPTVFTTTQFEFEVLNNRFMELAFLNPGLTIKLKDLRENEEIKYCFEGGLTEFCAYLSKGYKNLHPKPIYLSGRYNEIEVEIALQYILSDEEIMRTYVNDVNTIEGGTHLTGFRTALTRLVNDLSAMSRANSPQGLRLEPLELRDVVFDVARKGRMIARDRRLLVDAGEDALVNGNRDAITQILIALIDNATKFTQPGGTIGIQLQRAGGDVGRADHVEFRLRADVLNQIIRISLPVSFQNILILLGFLVFAAIAGYIGTTEQAATQWDEERAPFPDGLTRPTA